MFEFNNDIKEISPQIIQNIKDAKYYLIVKYCKHCSILTIPHILLCYITRNAQIERHYYVNKVIIENINITNNRITNIPH